MSSAVDGNVLQLEKIGQFFFEFIPCVLEKNHLNLMMVCFLFKESFGIFLSVLYKKGFCVRGRVRN